MTSRPGLRASALVNHLGSARSSSSPASGVHAFPKDTCAQGLGPNPTASVTHPATRMHASVATVETVVAAMDMHGYCVVEGFLSPSRVAQIRGEFDTILANNPLGRNDFEGYNTKRVYALFAKTRAFDEPATHPLVLGVLNLVLGRHYQLSSPVGIEIGAGERAQLLHRDTNKYPLPRGFPECVVNTMWAIDPFTKANGATVLYPGTHTRARAGSSNSRNLKTWARGVRGKGERRGSEHVLDATEYLGEEAEGRAPLQIRIGGPMPGSMSAEELSRRASQSNTQTNAVDGQNRELGGDEDCANDADDADLDSPVYGEMPAGSVLFYRGSLLHGGGANTTQKPRLGVILEYASGWLRPQESHLLAVPREIVGQLCPRLQQLLGYNIFPPFIGYVNGRHPKRVLE